MKKLLALLITLLSYKVLFAQVLPNTFQVGNYVELLPKDSIKIWYNCVGAISNSKCAGFYRIGKIDTDKISLTGEFKDYDLQGNVIYKAQMVNTRLNGKAYFYYPDGKVKETGEYVNDVRKGIWKYYFDEGVAEKILNFTDSTIYIIAQYDINGNQFVAEGEGVYADNFRAYGVCDNGYHISGHVKNGKMDGEWKFGYMSVETYANGAFVRGINTQDYGGKPYNNNSPKIRISGFYANENTQLYQNQIGCPGDRSTFFSFKSKPLTSGLYPDLIRKIKAYPKLKNQWIIIGIDFGGSSHIKTLNVYSSKDDKEFEVYIYNYISGLKGWDPWHTSSEKNPPLFFTISIDSTLGDENVMIPQEYISRKQTEAMFKN